MSRYVSYRDFDWLLLVFVLLICGLGVMEIRSATAHTKFAGAHIRQVYWVIGGATLVRQRLVDIIEDQWDDKSACAGLVLDPKLIAVSARPAKPFQGWRYLRAEEAPPDLVLSRPARGEAALPPALRRELRALCLL